MKKTIKEINEEFDRMDNIIHELLAQNQINRKTELRNIKFECCSCREENNRLLEQLHLADSRGEQKVVAYIRSRLTEIYGPEKGGE